MPDDDAIKLQELIAFADDLTESLMVQMIHTIHENGFEVNDKSFIQSMGFVIEAVKASVYKEMQLQHPMQRIMNTVSQVTTNPDETLYSEVDLERLENINDILTEDDDDPNLA